MKSLKLPDNLFTREEFSALIKSLTYRQKTLSDLENFCYGHLDALYSKVMEGKYRDYVKDPFDEEKELTVAEVVTDLKVNLANIKRNLYWLKRAHHKLLVIKEYAEVS